MMQNTLFQEFFYVEQETTKSANCKKTGSRRIPEDNVSAGIGLCAKRSQGLRERTLKDYNKHFGYFCTWLTENYPELQFIDELTTSIIRDHINYMRYDAKRYANHKYINSEKQRIGLSDITVNIRHRTLKAIFNQLRRDKLIEINAFESVNLLRQDVDLTNCFADEEVKAILNRPNQRDYVGFRDYVGIVTMLDSGLRIQELLSFRMNDNNFQSRFFTINNDQSRRSIRTNA